MKDVDRWTADWLEGELDSAGARLLRQRLENDPAARRRFAEQVRDHRALRVLLLREAPGRFAAAVERALDLALPDTATEAALARRWRPRPALRFARFALAAAAALLLAVGAGLVWRSHTLRGPALATVTEVRGRATGDGPGFRTGVALRAGAAVRADARIATQPDALVVLTLADGSVASLNEETAVQLLPPTAGTTLRLERGALYLAAAPRPPGAPALAIALANGHRAEALGTRFELHTQADETTLRVETGKVRLQAGETDATLTALTQATAKGRTVGKPEGIMPYEIADWKFRPQDVPAGAVLFEDDFEDGLDQWEIWYGQAEIVEGKGRNGSRALRLTWDSNARAAIMPAWLSRHRNYEVEWFIRTPYAGPFKLGTHVATPKGLDPSVVSRTLDVSHGPRGARPGRWMRLRAEVRDRIKHSRLQEGGALLSETKVEILGPFSRVGLYADEIGRNTLIVDRVVIRKLAD